jgi:hypothetical protein
VVHQLQHTEIARLASPPDAVLEDLSNWNRPPWDQVKALLIDDVMGDRPEFTPSTSAKLGWDDSAIYVMFRVEDRFVRAVARQHQDCVCADSCVEFFFCPGEDISKGYFNLEINCGGTMLFHFQKEARKGAQPLPPPSLDGIQINRTLPAIVEPEITEPVDWTIECRLPFEILQPHFSFTPPRPGDTWRANLYKCGDATSNPHWLTWSPIDLPQPDFHVPEAFGSITFT